MNKDIKDLTTIELEALAFRIDRQGKMLSNQHRIVVQELEKRYQNEEKKP
jgi:hypothetical protein